MGQHYSVQVLLPCWVDLEPRGEPAGCARRWPEIALATCNAEHITVAIPTDDLPHYVQTLPH